MLPYLKEGNPETSDVSSLTPPASSVQMKPFDGATGDGVGRGTGDGVGRGTGDGGGTLIHGGS